MYDTLNYLVLVSYIFFFTHLVLAMKTNFSIQQFSQKNIVFPFILWFESEAVSL